MFTGNKTIVNFSKYDTKKSDLERSISETRQKLTKEYKLILDATIQKLDQKYASLGSMQLLTKSRLSTYINNLKNCRKKEQETLNKNRNFTFENFCHYTSTIKVALSDPISVSEDLKNEIENIEKNHNKSVDTNLKKSLDDFYEQENEINDLTNILNEFNQFINKITTNRDPIKNIENEKHLINIENECEKYNQDLARIKSIESKNENEIANSLKASSTRVNTNKEHLSNVSQTNLYFLDKLGSKNEIKLTKISIEDLKSKIKQLETKTNFPINEKTQNFINDLNVHLSEKSKLINSISNIKNLTDVQIHEIKELNKKFTTFKRLYPSYLSDIEKIVNLHKFKMELQVKKHNLSLEVQNQKNIEEIANSELTTLESKINTHIKEINNIREIFTKAKASETNLLKDLKHQFTTESAEFKSKQTETTAIEFSADSVNKFFELISLSGLSNSITTGLTQSQTIIETITKTKEEAIITLNTNIKHLIENSKNFLNEFNEFINKIDELLNGNLRFIDIEKNYQLFEESKSIDGFFELDIKKEGVDLIKEANKQLEIIEKAKQEEAAKKKIELEAKQIEAIKIKIEDAAYSVNSLIHDYKLMISKIKTKLNMIYDGEAHEKLTNILVDIEKHDTKIKEIVNSTIPSNYEASTLKLEDIYGKIKKLGLDVDKIEETRKNKEKIREELRIKLEEIRFEERMIGLDEEMIREEEESIRIEEEKLREEEEKLREEEKKRNLEEMIRLKEEIRVEERMIGLDEEMIHEEEELIRKEEEKLSEEEKILAEQKKIEEETETAVEGKKEEAAEDKKEEAAVEGKKEEAAKKDSSLIKNSTYLKAKDLINHLNTASHLKNLGGEDLTKLEDFRKEIPAIEEIISRFDKLSKTHLDLKEVAEFDRDAKRYQKKIDQLYREVKVFSDTQHYKQIENFQACLSQPDSELEKLPTADVIHYLEQMCSAYQHHLTMVINNELKRSNDRSWGFKRVIFADNYQKSISALANTPDRAPKKCQQPLYEFKIMEDLLKTLKKPALTEDQRLYKFINEFQEYKPSLQPKKESLGDRILNGIKRLASIFSRKKPNIKPRPAEIFIKDIERANSFFNATNLVKKKQEHQKNKNILKAENIIDKLRVIHAIALMSNEKQIIFYKPLTLILDSAINAEFVEYLLKSYNEGKFDTNNLSQARLVIAKFNNLDEEMIETLIKRVSTQLPPDLLDPKGQIGDLIKYLKLLLEGKLEPEQSNQLNTLLEKINLTVASKAASRPISFGNGNKF